MKAKLLKKVRRKVNDYTYNKLRKVYGNTNL